jgi:hypothetical protein
MNKFEQLIEYVINDEEAKARELFHDIVVEKSRQIYEEMMQEEEELDEAESTDKEDEKAEKAGEKVTKDIEYDDAKDRKERKMHESADEDIDESMEEALGGDQADDLIDDIETEEQGLGEEEEDDDDHHADVGGEEELEDRVVDLEDKLDELMAEFEALMGGDEAGEEMDMEIDTPDMDAEEVVDDEMETEGMMKMPMEEAINLKAAPAPVKSEEAGVNKKSTVAANAGAKGPVGNTVKPTNLDQGGEATGRPAPQAKEMIGKVGNTPAQSTQDPKPATKPHLAQATGVNTKSVLKPV